MLLRIQIDTSCAFSGIYFRFQDADKRQVAVFLRVIQAISDDKFIRYLETAVINGNINGTA